MTFIEEAKALLSAEEMDTLMSLTTKSASFDTTADEDTTLGQLKAKVHGAVEQRNRAVQLAFLGDKKFTAAEILRAADYSRQEVMAAVDQLYPREVADAGGTIAVYPAGLLCENQRLTKVLKQAVSDGGVPGVVAHLTDFGRTHLLTTKVMGKGENAGKTTLANLAAFAKRVGLPLNDLELALAA